MQKPTSRHPLSDPAAWAQGQHRTGANKRNEPGPASVVVSDLWKIIEAAQIPYSALARASGCSHEWFRTVFRNGVMPNLRNLEEVGQVLGYRLRWEKIDAKDNT